jgi:UDP-N-acetylglucosamine transferase subunit ALG13
MIFVTVGTQLPFDRLIRAVDTWAGLRKRDNVFAQIGPSKYCPKHLRWVEFLDADACRANIEKASAIIAHAGMGTIISALELGKPIVVMPRLAALGEQRNDHQVATARQFLRMGRIAVAFDESQLLEKLDDLDHLQAAERIPDRAKPQLLDALAKFVDAGIAPAKEEFPAYEAVDHPAARPAGAVVLNSPVSAEAEMR